MRVIPLIVTALVIAVIAYSIVEHKPANRPTLVVLAASSLTDVAPALERAFEKESEFDLRFSFGGSALLAAQISQGAPADLLLSASGAAVRGLSAVYIESFARNAIVIAVAAGNPLGISGPADLAGHVVAVCAPEVPCGAASEPLIARYAITAKTLETDVKGVAGKVALGEVDAGLVYRTDVRADPRLAAIDTGMKLETTYFAAGLTQQSKEFADFLRSDIAQAILQGAGFLAP